MAAFDLKTEPLIRPITIEDYDAMIVLWRSLPGIGLSEADSRPNIASYLERNPGMCLAALHSSVLIGTILGGHDGRRGYIHHLAVSATHQGRGVGQRLVEECILKLRAAGISKGHLFVFSDNPAQEFWKKLGWERRFDINVMSIQI
jgi:N-acetylglutamate synthase